MSFLDRLRKLLEGKDDMTEAEIAEAIKKAKESDSSEKDNKDGKDEKDKQEEKDETGENKETGGDKEADKENKEQKDESDDKDKSTEDESKEEDKANNEDSKDKKGADELDSILDIFEEGWLNEADGTIDATKVKNSGVLAELNRLVGIHNKNISSNKINSTLDKLLSSEKLAVSDKVIRGLIDLEKAKPDDSGSYDISIKAEIDRIRTAEPALFKATTNPGSPIDEGFNPVNIKTDPNYVAKTLAEARAIQNEG